MKKIIAILLTLCALAALVGCGASEAPAAGKYEYAEEAPAATIAGLYEENGTSGGSALPEDRKLITTIHLDAETQDMDSLLTHLDDQVAQLGGYMEARSVYNTTSSRTYRRANLTIRIPADQANAFVKHVSELSNITSSDQTVEDVTLDYVATESRILALETEQERLLALMESAQTMSDLLEIEARLTEVRYELEQVTSRLRTYDNRINYATIHLSISQVVELTEAEPETFWDRISGGFTDNLRNLGEFIVDIVVMLITGLPYIVFFGGILVAALFLWKRLHKVRKTKKKAPPQE